MGRHAEPGEPRAGFQQDHYGLFLVAAISGLAFWIVEGTTKLHQMRFYPRMGDIEVAMFDLYRADTPRGPVSSPLLDWSWYRARSRITTLARPKPPRGEDRIPEPWPDERPRPWYGRLRYHPVLYAHVMFPHLVSVVVGAVLFGVGLCGFLGPI